MPNLTITADIELADAAVELLAEVFRCQPADVGLELSRFAPAAIFEFIDMVTGTATLVSAADVRERRLVRLMMTAIRLLLLAPMRSRACSTSHRAQRAVSCAQPRPSTAWSCASGSRPR